jgi:hypothetical protein
LRFVEAIDKQSFNDLSNHSDRVRDKLTTEGKATALKTQARVNTYGDRRKNIKGKIQTVMRLGTVLLDRFENGNAKTVIIKGTISIQVCCTVEVAAQ